MTSITNNIEISFWKFISNTSKIEIPIIQRDYAQGRDNEKTNKIRALFLDSLVEAIVSEKGTLELDFVYGNVEKDVFQHYHIQNPIQAYLFQILLPQPNYLKIRP